MAHSNWLYEYRTNVQSQHGEDGVIQQILEKIGIGNKWIVDIGAGDGVFISNSWHWINDEGWSAVCIEGEMHNFVKLSKYYEKRKDVLTFLKFVSVEKHIDSILEHTPVPQNFDILSIDIDSIDYTMWEMVEKYRPRIVVIEANASMAPDLEVIQKSPDLCMGSSSRAMVNLAKRKGYELAAHLVSNCIFVVEEEFEKLGIEDNSLETLFTSPFVPRVIADMKGVHHVLKEGPWGVSEVRIACDRASEIREREDGWRSMDRSLKDLNENNELEVAKSGVLGFTAKILHSWDIRSALNAYKERMSEYYMPKK